MHTDALVELIDIFPTLTELAGVTVHPLCLEDSNDLLACVEGSSVVPLLKDPKQEWKKASFSIPSALQRANNTLGLTAGSQYPRPYSGLSIPSASQRALHNT